MRILHTSDWHIGRQLHNVSLLEDQRHMLEQIVAIIRAQDVDVVIVAGDIYDRSVPPAAAVELLDETVNRICKELNKRAGSLTIDESVALFEAMAYKVLRSEDTKEGITAFLEKRKPVWKGK